LAHPAETVDALRRAYVIDRLPIEAAAEKVGVPPSTARKIKARAEGKGDDWDKARSVAALTAAGAGSIAQLVLADFLALHQSTVEALRTDAAIPPLARAEAMSRLADAFTKTMGAVAKAAPELGRFAVASELLEELARFVRGDFPQHGGAFVEVLEPFGAMLAAKWG